MANVSDLSPKTVLYFSVKSRQHLSFQDKTATSHLKIAKPHPVLRLTGSLAPTCPMNLDSHSRVSLDAVLSPEKRDNSMKEGGSRTSLTQLQSLGEDWGATCSEST